jgi:hypothetical protein
LAKKGQHRHSPPVEQAIASAHFQKKAVYLKWHFVEVESWSRVSRSPFHYETVRPLCWQKRAGRAAALRST